MATGVNLDALIRREDFDEIAPSTLQTTATRKETVSANDLKKGEFFFGSLRKPDFQRETNEWDAEKILDLIESFLSKELIPAIILWQSESNLNFIIDGSHRLSALASWVNDDYGDGEISKSLYEGQIPEEQIAIGKKVRALIDKKIGSYSDHKRAVDNPEKVTTKIVAQARILGSVSVQLQWVSGNSTNAESSFRKINEQGVPINSTEKKILKARKKPIGIAARAIIRGGEGNNFYWRHFSKETQELLKGAGKEVNQLLFLPKLKNPIKTLDLPLAGKAYPPNLPITWEFINIINPSGENDSNDPDGSLTLSFLTNCRRVAQRINSEHSSSLGLHPIVYLYSASGRHKPASLYALINLVMTLEKTDKFIEFIRARANFEKLLLENDYIVEQIVRKNRGAKAGLESITKFYLLCIQKLAEKKSIETVLAEIFKISDFNFLTTPTVELPTNEEADFSRAVKSRTFIQSALSGATRCQICNGYVHTNSISIDHIKDKKHGGDASSQNAQITHPFCNSAKDKIIRFLQG